MGIRLCPVAGAWTVDDLKILFFSGSRGQSPAHPRARSSMGPAPEAQQGEAAWERVVGAAWLISLAHVAKPYTLALCLHPLGPDV
jgi:hypothetical protein